MLVFHKQTLCKLILNFVNTIEKDLDRGCRYELHMSRWPGSLTQWKSGTNHCSLVSKWLPFSRQNTDFSAENDPFFAIKHWLFSSKWTPLFGDKTLTFQPKWTPFFTVKQWTSKLTPFSPNSEVSTKIPSFSRKMQILNFLKKYPFIRKF